MNKRELLEQAKEIYYNTGQEIMSDSDYDVLEEELGLENRNYVGARHNEQYTAKHPMIMGSLSKVQIKQNTDCIVDWADYASEILNYTERYNDDKYKGLIVTPKYDGCSFEIYYNKKKNDYTFSTRGDGEYGKNILHIFENNHIFQSLYILKQKTEESIKQYVGIPGDIDDIVWRGEILVNKTLFTTKYKDSFANPRAFVSGTINVKFDKRDQELFEQINDLDFIIYDIRYNRTVNNKQLEFTEFDWVYVWSKLNENKQENDICRQLLGSFPNLNSQDVMTVTPAYIKNKLSEIYAQMDNVRKESPYTLDGFVIKPVQSFRKNNNTEARPKDCVAVKFMPQIVDTKVKTIEWSAGKQGELFPVVIIEPVELDGKRIERVSGHNFGYIYNNYITEGAEMQISLAGDIIPFIYKVYNTDNINNIYKVLFENKQADIMLAKMNIRNIAVEISDDMVHLYKKETDNEVQEREFIERTIQAGIKSLGKKNTKKLADWCRSDSYINYYNDETDDFFENKEKNSIKKQYPKHLFFLADTDITGCFGGQTACNIIKDIERAKRDMKLSDIIRSCCFRNCGRRASEICASVIVDGIYDTTGIEYNAISWAFDEQSENYKFVLEIIKSCNKTLDDYKGQEYFALRNTNGNKDKVYIIMTGEPNTCSSKSEFLQLHPEYELTTSWKKCNIVFTNDMNSNTGKMKKAKDYIGKGYNIEIKEY